MAKVSDIVGAELFYTTARNFGFGTKTGLELSGEVQGELKKPTQWSGTTLNAMAYGYEVGVTPLQLVSAYAAVANGGTLMKPFVLKQVVDPRNKLIAETRPEPIRRVVSKTTAQTLTRFLRGAVENGTGKLASMKGVEVAGKTGTARKYIDGRYVEGSYMASFAGYFPAEEPTVVCLVMLDIPGSPSYSGGLVSAPIFKAIAEKIYATSARFTRKPALLSPRIAMRTVPEVTSMKLATARAVLASNGFEVEIRGTGSIVERQSPASGTKASKGTTVVLGTSETAATSKGYVIVPDLRGLPIRRAVNRLISQQLDVSITGSGTVVAQSQRAGDQVKAGTRIMIRCEPKNLPLVTLY
jgi:cell division protein FtsI (penicillin-binding protein 3)